MKILGFMLRERGEWGVFNSSFSRNLDGGTMLPYQTLQLLRNTISFTFMCLKLKNEFGNPPFFFIQSESAYLASPFYKVRK